MTWYYQLTICTFMKIYTEPAFVKSAISLSITCRFHQERQYINIWNGLSYIKIHKISNVTQLNHMISTSEMMLQNDIVGERFQKLAHKVDNKLKQRCAKLMVFASQLSLKR